MLRNKMSGFTLIELMVVIVIIGVLASLAIPRFTEASTKAKVAEAPRVLASFESAYLAAVAEVGDGEVTDDNMDLFKVPSSNWFTYTTKKESNGKVNGLEAGARTKLGEIAIGDKFYTDYANGEFTHGFSGCADPTPAPEGETETAKTAREAANAEAAAKCGPIKKYVPNFAGSFLRDAKR